MKSKLSAKATEVLTLEQTKLELQAMSDERTKALDVEKDLFRAQYRLLGDEHRQLHERLQEKMATLSKLKRRYEMQSMKFNAALASSMSSDEVDSENQPNTSMLSQSHFVLKAMRQNEDLRAELTAVEESTGKLEQDIATLEKSIEYMELNNDTLKVK